MRMVVFGALGNVGGRVVEEALRRGHEVTAVVSPSRADAAVPPPAHRRIGDASRAKDVIELARGQDIVVAATRPPAGREHELPAMAKALLDGTGRADVRLLLVGGAATLVAPGGALVIDTPQFMHPSALAIARACVEQYDVCRADTEADWTYASPSASLTSGPRTGTFRIGSDALLVDANGASSISVQDFAIALVDEAERGQHRRRRFTVGY